MDYFLGKKPTGATTDSNVDLGDIVRDIDELMILNDEAHHVHDTKLAWFKSIEDIHNRLLQKGSELALQVDVTATPKHNNGAIFVQTVSDYPLVEAISQNVVNTLSYLTLRAEQNLLNDRVSNTPRNMQTTLISVSLSGTKQPKHMKKWGRKLSCS